MFDDKVANQEGGIADDGGIKSGRVFFFLNSSFSEHEVKIVSHFPTLVVLSDDFFSAVLSVRGQPSHPRIQRGVKARMEAVSY